MSNSTFHQLLVNQIAEHLTSKGIDTETLMPFINAVNDSYKRFDNPCESSMVHTLLDDSFDIVTIVDENSRVVFESPAGYKLSGFTKEEVMGKSTKDIVHPEDLQETLLKIKEATDNPGTAITHTYRTLLRNGEYIWMESSAKYYTQGPIKGLVVNSRDISDRIKVENQMAAQNTLFETITKTMPVSIYRIDAKGNFTSSNGSALSRIGITSELASGLSFTDLYPNKAEDVQKAFSGDVVNFIGHTNYEGEDVSLEHFLFADNHGTEKSLIGFVIDVSDSGNKEDRMQDYYNALERTNKELDQFAYIISHDLKAPLRAISNLSIWIEEDIEDLLKDDTKKNFDLLRGRIQRMEQLINGVLEYSRAGRMQDNPVTFNAATIINEVVTMVAPPERFAVEIQPNMPDILMDRIKIEQVLSNFVSNAVKYNNNENPTIKIGYDDNGSHHVFYVEDNGPGIDAEYHEKVFVIFQTLQARDKVESTGVGLAIVKKIIEDAGGNVWVESEVGHGSKFFFSIPKTALAVAA